MSRKESIDKVNAGERRYSESFLISQVSGKSSLRVWA